MKIKDGPREKLMKNGVQSLKDEELLAILLKTGNKKENVLTLSKRILGEILNLENLSELSFLDLTSFKGIGPMKASTILASFELERRITKRSENRYLIEKPRDLYLLVKDNYLGIREEVLYAFFLNSSLRLIQKCMMNKGNFHEVLIDNKEILRKAIILKASFVALTHNHPSGEVRPSDADLEITSELKEMLKLFDIELFDHLIIGKKCYYSIRYLTTFREKNKT